ncbi:hypothetical protein QJS10_CPA16g00650 [Acorus calamus]|uniref:Uncharacterized protein n=1 Tax=Acorus calamus TaxID=4465 RepID=A0AAV9CZR6_ACOCL|nr:hypothetical protein QJS10_CPA16g00650 [Acorus calamus]
MGLGIREVYHRILYDVAHVGGGYWTQRETWEKQVFSYASPLLPAQADCVWREA